MLQILEDEDVLKDWAMKYDIPVLNILELATVYVAINDVCSVGVRVPLSSVVVERQIFKCDAIKFDDGEMWWPTPLEKLPRDVTDELVTAYVYSTKIRREIN